MTLLMIWTDIHDGMQSINMASDSLLSADQGDALTVWKYAAKIHRLHPTNDYFGYCGDSFLALSAISSAVGVITYSDHLQKVYERDAPGPGARISAIFEHLKSTFSQIPAEWREPTTLVLAGYDRRLMEPDVWILELTAQEIQDPQKLKFNGANYYCFGSGANNAEERIQAINGTKPASTKELVGVLVDVIRDDAEPTVGGAPQMVRITGERQAPVGFWWPNMHGKDERHLFGLPIRLSSRMKAVDWKTPKFEDR